MRLALDTNILAYAEGVNGELRQQAALELLVKLDPSQTVVPAQTLGELFHVLVKKAHWTRSKANEAIATWQDTYQIMDTSSKVITSATGLASDHGLAIWDAVIMAAASAASCRLLLSEDMHEGFTWNGLIILNPFSPSRHPLLNSLLSQA